MEKTTRLCGVELGRRHFRIIDGKIVDRIDVNVALAPIAQDVFRAILDTVVHSKAMPISNLFNSGLGHCCDYVWLCVGKMEKWNGQYMRVLASSDDDGAGQERNWEAMIASGKAARE